MDVMYWTGLSALLSGHSTDVSAPLPYPQTCVSVAPAWHLCQPIEVDALLLDAVMETKRWANRKGPEEAWEGDIIPLLALWAHLSQLIIAVMAQRNRGGGGGDKGWLGSNGGFAPVGTEGCRAPPMGPPKLGRPEPGCDSFWNPLSIGHSVSTLQEATHCLSL